LDAANWLQNNESVDYLVTLSAQDYPLRPTAEFHEALARSGDGMMEFFPVLTSGGNWPRREGRARYLFSWHDILPLSSTAKNRLRPLLAANRVQPLLRVNVAYDTLRLGVRRRSPFDASFQCWGGSFFTNLSWRCVDHILSVSSRQPEIMDWARRSLLIEEAFFQSILLSSDLELRFENTSARYYDFRGSRHGSPAVLGASDVPAALASGAFFGRKWDAGTSPEAFPLLDRALGI
jgi:hypothetical protein